MWFNLYRDYVLLATGGEVSIPIGEFKPCIIEYMPPTNPVVSWYYYPGYVIILLGYNGTGYVFTINTKQCRQLNTVLTTDFGMPRID